MAILIDPPRWPAHGILWSHLISDSNLDELHEFAARLGAPRRSFDLDHYDIGEYNYDRAIALGARPVSGHDLVRALRESGLRARQIDRPRLEPQHRRRFLEQEWRRLGGLFHLNRSTDWNALGTELLQRWSESHRSYHDERHLQDVLLSLNHLQTLGERISPTTLLAAWYHDAVYAGSVGEDERASAQLAVASLEAIGLDPVTVTRVRDFILATTPGTDTSNAPLPLAHLLDADLSIFGAGSKRYREYTESVRKEYAHVDEKDFRAGRAQILRSYLDRPTIYRLEASISLWEARARQNLEDEIATLTA
ncbi:MAG: DUF4031 domain-containing protein [Gulosibacter sp.]|uniref:DUF4031 domain-containing protein n=1 Tax=Gulosibacter sp. TaxID=2817531 RepID=UPI003F8DCF96